MILRCLKISELTSVYSARCHRHFWSTVLLLIVPLLEIACDDGLAPPVTVPVGTISGEITYTGSWPPADSLVDLRFVAMRFVPVDTSDFLQLNLMEFSETLQMNVVADSFKIEGVVPGTFFYSGVAQHFSTEILAWRPVGLVDSNGGIFEVQPGKQAEVTVHVDFGNLPHFPPDTE
jgi:hypothetical protein